MSIQGNSVGGLIPTAEQVGARPNTWTPTSAEVGSLPAIEDSTHPGCYYRMVDGEKEWINPPLVLGEEYRTTERRNGMVVYTKLVDFGAVPVNSSKTVKNVIVGTIFDIDGTVFNAEGVPFVTLATNTALNADFLGSSVSVQTTYDFSNCTAHLKVKFTKQ